MLRCRRNVSFEARGRSEWSRQNLGNSVSQKQKNKVTKPTKDFDVKRGVSQGIRFLGQEGADDSEAFAGLNCSYVVVAQLKWGVASHDKGCVCLSLNIGSLSECENRQKAHS